MKDKNITPQSQNIERQKYGAKFPPQIIGIHFLCATQTDKKHAVLVFWDEEIYESGLTDAMYQLVKVCEELILMINQNREKDDFVVVSRLLSGGHKHG